MRVYVSACVCVSGVAVLGVMGDLPVCVCVCERLFMCLQGIPSDFLARLPWWRLEVWKVSVMIDESWSLDDHFRVVPTLQEQLRGYVTCAARSDLELHVEDNPGTYYNTTSLEPNMRPDFHVYNDLTDDILSGLLRWDSLEIFE